MLNIVVAPYRDAYFYEKYGPAVRDLQILETLADLDEVKSIHVVNRPVSVYERISNKKKFRDLGRVKKVQIHDITRYDFIGPILQPRVWAGAVHAEYYKKLLPKLVDRECTNIFLDFTPIGYVDDIKELGPWLLWYDFIDNFSKHNRFNQKELKEVKDKYTFVRDNYGYVTFVSEACSEYYNEKMPKSCKVLTNKVFVPKYGNIKHYTQENNTQYDLGFVGFITDKMDVDFIEKLSRRHTIVIYGKFFDDNQKSILQKIKNVNLMGEFTYLDLPNIINSFKVGLVPYMLEKSHDESPLKVYEYLKNNKPCISSLDFEFLTNPYVINYSSDSFDFSDIDKLLVLSGDVNISKSLNDEHYLKNSLADCIKNFL
tara:strand:- start:2408 stop:3520 length:1113 start_codon:yes stop_codon:yes gene_type:complete